MKIETVGTIDIKRSVLRRIDDIKNFRQLMEKHNKQLKLKRNIDGIVEMMKGNKIDIYA